jgi:hypothetical protein
MLIAEHGVDEDSAMRTLADRSKVEDVSSLEYPQRLIARTRGPRPSSAGRPGDYSVQCLGRARKRVVSTTPTARITSPIRASPSDELPVLARPPLVGVMLDTSVGKTLLDDVELTTSVGKMLPLAGVELGTLTVCDGEIEPDSEDIEVTVCEGEVEVWGAVVGTVSVGPGELEDGEFDMLVSEGKIDSDGLLDVEVAVSLGVGVTLELCGGGG